MRFLCDTQHFIWTVENQPKLSSTATRILSDNSQLLYLSLVSVWEMVIKVSLGKLTFSKPLSQIVEEEFASNRFLPLEITLRHLKTLHALPLHHRDPFDRLIIAQAIAENLPVISSDAHFDAYPIKRIW
jgi:PIN domain nuclease of toxin-antitoxin system